MKRYKISFITKCFASIIAVIIIIFSANLYIQNFLIQSIYLDNKTEIQVDEIKLLVAGIENAPIKTLPASDTLEEFEFNIENALVIVDEKEKLGEKIFSKDNTTLLLKYKTDTHLDFLKQGMADRTLASPTFTKISSDPALYITKDTTYSQDGIKVHIVTLMTVDEIQPIFQALNKYYSIQYIITLALILGFGMFFTIKFKKPVSMLKEYAKNIASAKFDPINAELRNDELGELHDSLTQISNSLSQKIDQINQQKDQEVIERKRITTLLTNLSHEFKTPLGVISGFVEMMEDNIQPENHQEFLAIIEDEVERLNLLVNESLELTKYESQKVILHMTAFSIQERLQKACNKFTNELAQKKLTINTSTLHANVMGDLKKIDQVLTNLISNAIKYSYEQSTIDISIEADEKQVHIEIENTCDEVNELELSKLWDAYYRNDSSRNRSISGSGLGLSIVKSILDLHQSHYGVRYKANKMTFHFTLYLSDIL